MKNDQDLRSLDVLKEVSDKAMAYLSMASTVT